MMQPAAHSDRAQNMFIAPCKTAGDLVFDRIFNYHSPERTVPDDFGVLLTSQNIEAHLAHIRTDREQYRLSHPEDVAEIEAMAREVAKTKRCTSLPK